MKLTLLASVLLASAFSSAYAAYKPVVKVTMDEENTIFVSALNTTDYDYHCKYSVSRFVNGLSWKTDFGSVVMSAGEEVNLAIEHNQEDRITLPRARFVCQ